MSNSSQENADESAIECRRRDERIALPVELEVVTDDGAVPVVVRDISLTDSVPTGIAILHQTEFPDDQEIRCRTIATVKALPTEFMFSVRWTRSFGSEGHLSGGTIGEANG